ncbi:hypothetical protein K8U54_24335 [Pseudomonas fulva]|uniref:hypothetical protein n=1 Tax=Pseudomonas fulva TaxID=47880 RepID=UPI00201D8B95|nr:hypothetical protein [Pseudomonas fulva]UQY34788.1 hypothetical protein K8U54_24335 [Pseudomonas fulva]
MIINNQYLNQTNTSYLRERRTATTWENRTITKNLTDELVMRVNLQAPNMPRTMDGFTWMHSYRPAIGMPVPLRHARAMGRTFMTRQSKAAAPPGAAWQLIYSERPTRGMALNLQTANHTEGFSMDMLIKQLKTVTAGRYHIITETSAEGLQVDCLDLQCNLVATRRLTAAQLQNKILMTAVYADLKGTLGY